MIFCSHNFIGIHKKKSIEPPPHYLGTSVSCLHVLMVSMTTSRLCVLNYLYIPCHSQHGFGYGEDILDQFGVIVALNVNNYFLCDLVGIVI